VIGALKGIGLDKKALKTEAVDIQPKYSDPGAQGQGAPNIVGYTATNRIRVTTKKVDMLGQIIDTAVTAGANTVDTMSMIATARVKAEADGLEQAIDNARKKARSAAKAAGRKLGRVIKITEQGVGPLESSPETWGMSSLCMVGGPIMPVAPGQNEYEEVTATVVFRLQ